MNIAPAKCAMTQRRGAYRHSIAVRYGEVDSQGVVFKRITGVIALFVAE